MEQIVNKVKAGKYLSDEEMEKLTQFASESDYEEIFDYVHKAEIIKKIIESKHLSEAELEELAYCSKYVGLFTNNLVDVVSRKEEDSAYKNITTILKIDNKLYAVDWKEGFSEKVFKEQPYRVKKVKRIIEIAVPDYERIEE